MGQGMNRAKEPRPAANAFAGVLAPALLKAGLRPRRQPCVFLSHKKEDTAATADVAKYLMDSGVDVYFDEYDKTLGELVREGDCDAITERLMAGIKESTHMLCVYSPHTRGSLWVPFEVGFGYGFPLAVLTLAGIGDEELPEYMKTTDVIRGAVSLDELIQELLQASDGGLEGMQPIHKSRGPEHPLSGVLDIDR